MLLNEIKTLLRSCSYRSSNSIHLFSDFLNRMFSSIQSLIADIVAGSKPWGPRGLGDMLKRNWYLGLTSFGGPAVHFQIVCINIEQDRKTDPSC